MDKKILGLLVAGVVLVAGFAIVWITLNPLDGMMQLDYISIDNEDDFSEYGFGGDGTASNPYIIENIRISNPSGGRSCIRINDIDAYFVIRYCDLSLEPGSDACIMIDYSSNFDVYNCTLTGGYWGFIAVICDNINIAENNILNCTVGISFTDCTNYAQSENTFTDCDQNIYTHP